MAGRMRMAQGGLLIAAGAWIVLLLASFPFPPRIDRKLPEAIGQALAKAALGLRSEGGQIIVITRDTKSFPQPSLDLLLAGFEREVRQAKATISSTYLVQTDPLRPVEVPSGDFYERIRRASDGQVIVSLLGPPLLAEEQRAKLGRIKPKIVAFCPGNIAEVVDLRILAEAGLLHAAVVSRRHPPHGSDTPRAAPKTFDRLYRTVTAAEFSQRPWLEATL